MSYLPPDAGGGRERAARRVLRRAVPGDASRSPGRRRCSTPRTRGSGADRPVNILVCVKRVPATGGQIVLTADGQDIDTRFLGFTISPHEECGVEEAVRIVEAQGGSSTVLTLGPARSRASSSATRWRSASTGVLLETDGARLGPGRDGRRDRRGDPRLRRPRTAPFDLILFGNEAADTGDFQVGIRVATALGRPVVSGVKGIVAGDGARRGAARGGGRRLGGLRPADAGGARREGGAEPAALSVACRAGCGRGRRRSRTIVAGAAAGRPDEGAAAAARRDREPGRGHRPGRGGGAGGRRAVPEARGA